MIHSRAANLIALLILGALTAAVAIIGVRAHGGDHDHDHLPHGMPKLKHPAALATAESWAKKALALPERHPLRLVQLDSVTPDDMCRIELGDVYDLALGAGPALPMFRLEGCDGKATSVDECVFAGSSSSASVPESEREERIRSFFPPLSREDHGMIGAHSEQHHQIFVAFKVPASANGTSSNPTTTTKDTNQEKTEEEMMWVGSTFLDPRLHVGESRYEHIEKEEEEEAERAQQQQEQEEDALLQEGAVIDNDVVGNTDVELLAASSKKMGQSQNNDNNNKPKTHGKKKRPSSNAPHKHEFFKVPFEESHVLRIPRTVKKIHIFCHGQVQTFDVNQAAQHSPKYFQGVLRPSSPLRRTAKQSAGTAGTPEVYQIKTRGPPTSQLNVIFLSAGYTAEQGALYNASVARAIKFFDPLDEDAKNDPDLISMHKSVPWDRYNPFMNIYSVWQSSPQEGASRPKLGLTVDNNLGCYHPETIERACTCNRKLAMALADTTPAKPLSYPDKSVIITVVNTPLYGGSAQYKRGDYHVGYFYQGTDTRNGKESYDNLKYASLVKHEIGHGLGNLFDEYDIGIPTSSQITLQNCQSKSSPLQWSAWEQVMNGPDAAQYKDGIVDKSVYGIASSAIPICGYSNYYKPNSNCMMQQLRDYFMCPVCRDAATRTMFDLSKMKTSWPRNPTEDSTYIVPETTTETNVADASTGILLHLPSYLVAANDFAIKWFDDKGAAITATDTKFDITVPSCETCIRLKPQFLQAVTKDVVFSIAAEVQDQTKWVLETIKTSTYYKPLFFQKAEFKVKVVTTVDKSKAKLQPPIAVRNPFGHNGEFGDKYSYYTECLPTPTNPEPICNLSFSATPYKAPQGLNDTLNAAEYWVYIVLAVCAVIFIIAWYLMLKKFEAIEKKVVRYIFDSSVSTIVEIIYKIMNASAVLFMVMSVCTLAASGVLYSQVSDIGKIIIFPGIFLAVGLFIMAFTGYWSLKLRSIRLVIANGVVLYVGFTVLFILTALVINFGEEISDRKSYWNNWLKTFWQEMVADNPERACGFEKMLECSGYFLSCSGVGAAPEYCPINCEPNFDYATPCQKLIQDWINNNYTKMMAVMAVCCILMVFALIFNFIFFYNLVRQKADLQRKNDEMLESASMAQYGMRADKNDPARALKRLQLLTESEAKRLVVEFRRVDTDGNGELDPLELRNFFKQSFGMKVTMEQIKYLFNIADKDGSGSISVPEFLALFQNGEELARQYTDDEKVKARIDAVTSKVRTSSNLNRDSSTIDLKAVEQTRTSAMPMPSSMRHKNPPIGGASSSAAKRAAPAAASETIVDRPAANDGADLIDNLLSGDDQELL